MKVVNILIIWGWAHGRGLRLPGACAWPAASAARAPNKDTREGDRSEDSNLLWRVTSAVKSAIFFRR